MSIVSGQWSGKRSKSSKSNGAKITAPNGSVISRNSNNQSVLSSPVKSVSGEKKSSIQGSIISHTKSATLTHRSSKGASVLSGVSSQVARRKKQREQSEHSSHSINVRAMSATSLNRRESNDSQNISAHLKRYSQSDASIAIKSEIESMTKEERDILRNTIDRYKTCQNIEKNRNTALVRKIKEIQSLRPPYSEFQTNVCYICQRIFWPIIFVKYACNRCQIFVCKNCLKPYNSNTICNQCFQEMIYLSKSDLLLKKRRDNDDSDSDNHIDVDAITKIIKQTDKNENAYSYHQTDSNLDHIDESPKSSASTMSLFKKLLNKRKSDSVSLSKSKSELSLERSEISDEKTKFDSISMTSLTIINSSVMLNLADHHETNVLRDGEIMVGVSYNFNTEEFRVIIKKCKDLEIAIPNQKSSNAYIKVNLLPPIANEKVFKTKVVYSNLNPEFNEHCRYKHIKYDDVIARTVLVTVWHSERLGKDVFLGQVHLKLSSLSLDDATPQWHRLTDKKPATIHPTLTKYYGDIQFSIKYCMSGDVMSDGSQTEDGSDMSFSFRSLILWIKQANNLLTSSYSSLPNAYVKCLILPETSKVPAKKSPIIRKNFNPIWNIPFPFTNIPLEDLAKSGMEITIWDKRSGLLRDTFLGGVSLNISRSGRLVPNNEVEVWQRMIDKPGTWIEAKMVLRKDLK